MAAELVAVGLRVASAGKQEVVGRDAGLQSTQTAD